MATVKLVETTQSQVAANPAAATRGLVPLDTSVFNDMIGGSIDSVRQEIDDAFADMKTLYQQEPDVAMRHVMGHSARLSEIRVNIMRIEDYAREWKNIRTREVEPTIEELERQYTIASRLHSVRELDWKIESGDR